MDDNKKERLSVDSNKEQNEIWYKSHNIIREKSELYYDFLLSLLNIIDESYLGSDIIVTESNMMEHFEWCFNKVVSNFSQERIYFDLNSEYYDYLWFFFYKAYYKSNTEEKYKILSDYFKLIFDFNKIKTPIELESFTDLYKIFDKNLKKIK